MTTDPHDEYGEILRRALHAEADEVVPAPEGLERIHAGIAAGRGRWPLSNLPAVPWQAGRAWLSESWTRPLLAGAGVMLATVVALSAPATFQQITSTGSGGPSGSGSVPGTDSSQGGGADGGAAPGQPRSPGSGALDDPTGASATPPSGSATGAPLCGPSAPPASAAPTGAATAEPGCTTGPSVPTTPSPGTPVTPAPEPPPDDPPPGSQPTGPAQGGS